MPIAISQVQIGVEERALIEEALSSGHLAQGRLVAMFESQFAAVSGAPFAVATSSGTSALQLALEVAGVGPGDEVITTPFTFVATINAILSRGATARLVDIDPTTFNLRADLANDAVNTKTKAIVPVHLYGLPADMATMKGIHERTGVRIVEDAAQAHLSSQGDYQVGTLDLGCFSLYATKNVAAGEGGVVTGARPEDEERLRILRNQGMKGRYEYVALGYNYRLNELAAAIALGQLKRLTENMALRQRNALFLTEALQDIPGLITPTTPPGFRHVWHQYTIRVTPDARQSRDSLVTALTAAGVGTGVYYPHVLTDYPPFAQNPLVKTEGIPEARRAAEEVLSLPVHAGLTEGDLTTIADAVHDQLA